MHCAHGSNTSTYVYGADGYRHQSTVNGVTTDFVLDGQFVTRERRSGINYATYFIGANGPLYRRDDASGSVRWYLFDGLGSVLGEVDPAENVTDFNKYDVYGALRSRSGTATTAHGFVGQLGHTSEAETGLIYMRARYMDPVVGRFVSEDPGGNGDNWYAYCTDDPAGTVDANGREGLSAGLMIRLLIWAQTSLTGAERKDLAFYLHWVARKLREAAEREKELGEDEIVAGEDDQLEGGGVGDAMPGFIGEWMEAEGGMLLDEGGIEVADSAVKDIVADQLDDLAEIIQSM